MYESYFGLKTRPFVTVPSPETYFPAAAIERARQSVLRLVQRGAGPAIVVGSVGTGKTLLCGLLAKQLRARHRVVQLASTRISTRRGFLQAILFELGLPYRGLDEGELRLAFNSHVSSPDICPHGLALLVDEADRLPKVVFEELRMTTNLVANSAPSVRPILFGGPHLEEIFADPKLESFNQRLAGRYYLEPFSYRETIEYVKSRIESTGSLVEDVLTDDALDAIHKASYGIPRLINQVCEHALMLGYVGQHRQLGSHDIQEAWSDLQQLPAALPAVNQQSTVIEFGQLDDEGDTDGHLVAGLATFTGQAAVNQLDSIQQQLDELELEMIPVSPQPSSAGGHAISTPVDPASSFLQPDESHSPLTSNLGAEHDGTVTPIHLMSLPSGSLAAAEWGWWRFVQDAQPQAYGDWTWATAAVAAAVGSLSLETTSAAESESQSTQPANVTLSEWAIDEDAPCYTATSVPPVQWNGDDSGNSRWSSESSSQIGPAVDPNSELRVHHAPLAIDPFAEAFDEEEVVVDQFTSPRVLLSSDAVRVEAAESRDLARQIELLLASELNEMWDIVESGVSEDAYHLPESPTPFELLADDEPTEAPDRHAPLVVKFPSAEPFESAEPFADSDAKVELAVEAPVETARELVVDAQTDAEFDAEFEAEVEPAAASGLDVGVAATEFEAPAPVNSIEAEGMSVWRHVTVPFSPPPFSLQPLDGVLDSPPLAGPVESPVPVSGVVTEPNAGNQVDRAGVQKSLKWLFSTLKSR